MHFKPIYVSLYKNCTVVSGRNVNRLSATIVLQFWEECKQTQCYYCTVVSGRNVNKLSATIVLKFWEECKQTQCYSGKKKSRTLQKLQYNYFENKDIRVSGVSSLRVQYSTYSTVLYWIKSK